MPGDQHGGGKHAHLGRSRACCAVVRQDCIVSADYVTPDAHPEIGRDEERLAVDREEGHPFPRRLLLLGLLVEVPSPLAWVALGRVEHEHAPISFMRRSVSS